MNFIILTNFNKDNQIELVNHYVSNIINIITYFDNIDKKFDIYYISNMGEIPSKFHIDLNSIANERSKIGMINLQPNELIPFFNENIENPSLFKNNDYIILNISQ